MFFHFYFFIFFLHFFRCHTLSSGNLGFWAACSQPPLSATCVVFQVYKHRSHTEVPAEGRRCAGATRKRCTTQHGTNGDHKTPDPPITRPKRHDSGAPQPQKRRAADGTTQRERQQPGTPSIWLRPLVSTVFFFLSVRFSAGVDICFPCSLFQTDRGYMTARIGYVVVC